MPAACDDHKTCKGFKYLFIKKKKKKKREGGTLVKLCELLPAVRKKKLCDYGLTN
jgi:hypothetical protein